MMKKFYALLIAVAMMVSVTACGSKAPTNEVQNELEQVEAEVEAVVEEAKEVVEEPQDLEEGQVTAGEGGLESDEAAKEDSKADEKGGSDADSKLDMVDGMRPEFKEAMDSYEEFYEEYCEVLKKYMEDPTDVAVLTQYSDLMQQSIEMAEKFEEWDNGELNTEELKYYVEVNGRVTQMLVEASGQ